MAAPSLLELQSLTYKFSVARQALAGEVAALNEKIEALKKDAMPRLRKLVGNAAEHKANLSTAIDGARGLFESPRTVVFHGIKIGLRKGAGGIDWQDDAKTVELIRKHFTKPQADLLIKTTEKPITKALAELDAGDLKKIGCTIEDTGDIIVIKPTDSEVDNIVAALLDDATEEKA